MFYQRTLVTTVQNESASITLEEKAISQTVWYGSAYWVAFVLSWNSRFIEARYFFVGCWIFQLSLVSSRGFFFLNYQLVFVQTQLFSISLEAAKNYMSWKEDHANTKWTVGETDKRFISLRLYFFEIHDSCGLIWLYSLNASPLNVFRYNLPGSFVRFFVSYVAGR